MNKKIVKKYLIFYFTLSIILTSSYPQAANLNNNKQTQLINSENDYIYGFIIPLPNFKKISKNPELQNSTLNLINDLLRINIQVYWVENAIELKVNEITNTSKIELKIFESGTFIVPFTNNYEINKKIIVIMDDYGISHELFEEVENVNIYFLYEPFVLKNSNELIEPKAAYYFGDGVFSSSMNWYVSTLSKAGFLNNEYLLEEEIIEKLNNGKYNVFIWPGGDIVNDVNSDIPLLTRFLRQNEIKKFVLNGGGYVGSCYGAYSASSGIRLLPLSILKYYFPKIPSYGYLGLQDSYTALAISCSINVTINDESHPVTYGSKKTLHGSELLGGCVYTKMGKNTKSLAKIKEVNSTVWTHWFRDLFGSDSILSELIIKYWIEFTTGKTVWTTSNYGSGKVVAFGDHPEAGNINHKRIIQNSVFYVNSIQTSILQIDNSLSYSDIEIIRDKSNNLKITDIGSDIFSDLKININKTLKDLNNFQNYTFKLYNKTWTLYEQEIIDISFAISIFVSGMWEFSQSIQRAITYLNNSRNNEDTIYNLNMINSINSMLESENNSIKNSLTKFNNDLLNKIYKNNDSITKIYSNFDSLLYELNNYYGSPEQNESIVSLCEKQWDNSRYIEKTYPSIYFDTSKKLREFWYNYESNI